MQDPVAVAIMAAQMRKEFGIVRTRLMLTGMPWQEATERARFWLSRSVATTDVTNPSLLPKQLAASRQSLFRELSDQASTDSVRQARESLSEAAVELAQLTEELPPRQGQEAYEAASAKAPEVVPDISADVPQAGDMPASDSVAAKTFAEFDTPAEIRQPSAGLSAPQEQSLRAGGTESVVKPDKPADSPSWGAALAVLGAAQQVIGNFYAIKSQQTQLKQQAMSLEFQQRMSQINARAAERQASDIIAAGRQQALETTLRAGQAREGARATMAARGVRANVGSGAEVVASIDLMKEIDRFTIDANAVRAAGAARMQAVNASNEGLLAGTSAFSLRQQAGAMNPVVGAMPSLLTGIGQYYSQRAADRRWAAWAASQGLGE